MKLIDKVSELEIPYLVAFNKNDLCEPLESDMDYCRQRGIPFYKTSVLEACSIDKLKEAIITLAPEEMKRDPVLAGDLFCEGDWVVCVVPIDLAAPKGRLILPQVQVLREILDCDAVGVTVKEREIEETLSSMKRKPALVITDSQVVMSVAGDVPDEIPLTTFSTLFARYKGDLPSLVEGAKAIDSLQDGDTVLMGEACSHHPVADDIGKVKIPRWIRQYTGNDINFRYVFRS